MADITMCAKPFCEKEKSCYRKTAKLNKYRQSMCEFTECNEPDFEYYYKCD